MKTIRKYFTKNILVAVLMAILGVLLLVGGETVTEALKWLSFGALLVLCVVELIVFIRENNKLPEGSDSIIYALLALILAVYIFKKWDHQFSDLAKIAFALVIIISGFYKLKMLIVMVNQKVTAAWVLLILGIAGTGLGIWVLFNMPENCYLLLGIGFLYSAVTDAITDVWFRSVSGTSEKPALPASDEG